MSIPGLKPSINARLCCLEKGQEAFRDEFEQQLVTVLAELDQVQEAIVDLQEQIDLLEEQIGHTAISITSFTVSPNVAEVGSTLTSLNFDWALNKVLTGPPATQSISPAVGSVPPPDTDVTAGVNITASTVFTLTVNDGLGLTGSVDTKTVSVAFRHRAYWGTDADATLDSGGILDLEDSAIASGRARTFTVDGNGEYIYYAYQSSFDSVNDASFEVNGFPTTGWVKTTVSFTNIFGNTTSFSVYRSAAVQNGTGITVTVT